MPKPSKDQEKYIRIKELRDRLRGLERAGGSIRKSLPFGLPALDEALGGGLPLGCLHEIIGRDGDGAATGFCAALLARLAAAGRPVLWCQRAFDLYGPGLAELGLDPDRLIVLAAGRPAERLQAMEEGLRCPALAAVLAEVDGVDLTTTRRLQLAAETGGVTGFVRRLGDGAAATAAVTRWRVTAAPAGHGVDRSVSSSPRETVGKWLGAPRWRVELLRCRGGQSGNWLIDWVEGGWRDATDTVALAAALRDGPAARAARA
ncbi:MAG: ImuA family protein [Dongiaceae bacterium]